MTTVVSDGLKKIGDTFSKRRKEMNISLKEVENGTSIRMAYLQAIEEGQMERLISPVYAQGFVKQYANFLGVDGDALVREHSEVFSKKESQDFAYGIGTLEMRGHPGSHVKWVPNALWFVAFALLFIVAWYAAKLFELF